MAKSTKHVTIKRVFGSMFNNATAIDGAKFSPWWAGLILFILGLILPIVPLFVKAATTNGTSFMANTTYGLGLDKTFGQAINDLDGFLTFNNNEKTISYSPNSTYTAEDTTLIGGYVATSGTCAGQYELRVYYKDAVVTEEELSSFVSAKESIGYKTGTTTAKAIGEDGGYIPSSIYFFKNTFYMDIYASNSLERKAAMQFQSDLTCLDYSGSDLKEYFCGNSFNKDSKESRLGALDNLKTFIDTTYKTSKTTNMLLGSLLYLGIYVGMNFFMILMIFIMSRGKNNPNNYLTFWHCIKIDWWASFCPGLLGLVFGFIFSNYATMIYVMCLAMRTMWLTMREMRPQY